VFVLVSRSGGGRLYLKIAHAVRTRGTICRRHIESLGRYDEQSFLSYREIVRDWKPLARWPAVVAELRPEAPLSESAGQPQRLRREGAQHATLAWSCPQPPAGGP
jgi:hypothetical protein